MHDVKGRHEVDTTVACTEAYPHSSWLCQAHIQFYKTIGYTTHVYYYCDDTMTLIKMTHVLLQWRRTKCCFYIPCQWVRVWTCGWCSLRPPFHHPRVPPGRPQRPLADPPPQASISHTSPGRGRGEEGKRERGEGGREKGRERRDGEREARTATQCICM